MSIIKDNSVIGNIFIIITVGGDRMEQLQKADRQVKNGQTVTKTIEKLEDWSTTKIRLKTGQKK